MLWKKWFLSCSQERIPVVKVKRKGNSNCQFLPWKFKNIETRRKAFSYLYKNIEIFLCVFSSVASISSGDYLSSWKSSQKLGVCLSFPFTGQNTDFFLGTHFSSLNEHNKSSATAAFFQREAMRLGFHGDICSFVSVNEHEKLPIFFKLWCNLTYSGCHCSMSVESGTGCYYLLV